MAQGIKHIATLLITVLLTASAYGQSPIALGPKPPAVPDEGLHAILLGTGIPIPNPDRAGASTLIVAGGKTIMVDTGWNSLVSLAGNGYQDVDLVLYTHFHSDHYGGLSHLFMSRGGGGAADQPLRVMGPKGTKQVVDDLLQAYRIDEGYRIAHHGDKWHANAMQADVTDCEPGVILEEDGLTITMFTVNHLPIEPAVGYRFDYEGKSIVVSGDTVKSDSLIAAAKDCDLLIHEAMDARMLKAVLPMAKRMNPRMGEMLTELMEYHTPNLEVAEVAKEANAKNSC